jgi:hypothetical protein
MVFDLFWLFMRLNTSRRGLAYQKMCFEYFELQQGKMFQVVGRLRQKRSKRQRFLKISTPVA